MGEVLRGPSGNRSRCADAGWLMFPVAALRLSLAEIAALWAEEMAPARTATQVQWFLEKAFWRGEFRGEGQSRLDLLRRLRCGSVPASDPATWTNEECGPLFESIAKCWPYHPQHCGGPVRAKVFNYERAFADIELSRAEFLAWIIRKRFYRPTFWGPYPEIATPGSEKPRPAPDRDALVSRRKPGRSRKLRKLIKSRMLAQLESGTITLQQLADLQKKQLAPRYGGKDTTAWQAREEVLRDLGVGPKA
jgi:hypothetical protein